MIPVASEGYMVIIPLFFIAVVALFFGFGPGLPFLVLLFFVVAFFRDPNRPDPPDKNGIYSPADGKIMSINSVKINEENYYQIIIFLSVLNCHINRIPFSGRVISTHYFRGLFKAAFSENIDKENERMEVWLETSIGKMKVIQIAGFIARRIVCRLKVNQQVEKGERFGLIKFGSRTDLIIPQSCKILVTAGMNVKGSITKLAEI